MSLQWFSFQDHARLIVWYCGYMFTMSMDLLVIVCYTNATDNLRGQNEVLWIFGAPISSSLTFFEACIVDIHVQQQSFSYLLLLYLPVDK